MSRLSSIGRIWLCIALLSASLASAAEPRRVVLTARIGVANGGDKPVAPFYLRLTVPPADHPQQRLADIRHADGAAVRKPHKNGVDVYLEYRWDIPAKATLVREVGFVLDLVPFDEKSVQARAPEDSNGRRYLAASDGIEADAPALRAVAADLTAGSADRREQARVAYDYVRRTLKVRDMSENRGALYALEHGGGDCTEFNSLLVALARAMGIPARTTAEFLFDYDTPKTFAQPNHHGAEVYLDGRWLPVDANLAVDPAFGYGFGYGGRRKVLLRREGAWVWSYWAPGADKTLKVDVAWSLRDLAGGGR